MEELKKYNSSIEEFETLVDNMELVRTRIVDALDELKVHIINYVPAEFHEKIIKRFITNKWGQNELIHYGFLGTMVEEIRWDIRDTVGGVDGDTYLCRTMHQICMHMTTEPVEEFIKSITEDDFVKSFVITTPGMIDHPDIRSMPSYIQEAFGILNSLMMCSVALDDYLPRVDILLAKMDMINYPSEFNKAFTIKINNWAKEVTLDDINEFNRYVSHGIFTDDIKKIINKLVPDGRGDKSDRYIDYIDEMPFRGVNELYLTLSNFIGMYVFKKLNEELIGKELSSAQELWHNYTTYGKIQ